MLSRETVKYVANLSRIHLQDDEVEALTRNLADILQYVEKLEKLDVTGVHPTSHVLAVQNVYRDDQIQPSLPREEVLKTAVSPQNGFFKVPQVIE